MKKMLLVGASGGIGQACAELLKNCYTIDAPDRSLLNFSDPESVDKFDTSEYEIILNCAGSNKGTYQGFTHNQSTNQIDQINVNYVSPLILLKNYLASRDSGHWAYISSISLHRPHEYNIVGCSSKFALKFAVDEIAKKHTNFVFTEVCPGKTKTNMLYQNYCGIKTVDEVEQEYEQSVYLSARQVADLVVYCISNKISQATITP